MSLPRALPRALSALFVVLLALAQLAAAQSEVDEVLAALEASAADIVDLSFVLEGQLVDEAGQVFNLELEVLAIPAIPAAGVYIVQPDALADNQLVLDGDVVRNYTYMTHQVSVFNLDDPDAFGGLIAIGEGEGLPVNLDLSEVFAGWAASIVDRPVLPQGQAVQLRFDNLDPDAVMQYVLATVIEGSWDPYRLVFYRAGGHVFADLRFENLVRNQGLSREDVTYLPEDAEVLDRRR